MQALTPYWQDRAAHENAVRGFLTLEATQSQYLDGVADPTAVNPDLWELDQRYLDLPGRDAVMFDLLYAYQTKVAAYPAPECFRSAATAPFRIPGGDRRTTRSQRVTACAAR